MADKSRLTETRIGPDGKPRLFSKLSEEEYKALMNDLPANYDRATKGLVLTPGDSEHADDTDR